MVEGEHQQTHRGANLRRARLDNCTSCAYRAGKLGPGIGNDFADNNSGDTRRNRSARSWVSASFFGNYTGKLRTCVAAALCDSCGSYLSRCCRTHRCAIEFRAKARSKAAASARPERS